MITLIVLLPFLAAIVIAAVPRNYRFAIRLVALAATLCTAIVAAALFWQFDPAAAGYQFEQKATWVQADRLAIRYHVGVDGINIGLLLMAALVAFAATGCSWEIREREKEFYFLLMVMVGGILGAFVSFDLFFLFFFHELALIPTFVMIGVWGRGPNRNYATFQMTLYLSLGALVALVGLVAIFFHAGVGSFDLAEISDRARLHPFPIATQHFIFPWLLFGFGVLVSLWPFHTWAPLGYSAAPTPTAMLHAGVLKKFGVYGLIRIALPLLPDAARSWAHVIALLCLGNILYNGLVAIRQRDLNFLIGNSSVAHMGFIFLGIASLTWLGITGAVVVMVAHGFLAALTFGLSGFLYQQTGTLEMAQFSGLIKRMPFIGTVMIMAMLAGCGLPGFANFVGEVMVFFGAWQPLTWVTGFAVWGGLVIGAVYMLRAVRRLWHGPLPESWAGLHDAIGVWRKLPFAILLGGLILFGFFPGLLVNRIKGSAHEVAKALTAGTGAASQSLASLPPDAPSRYPNGPR